MAHLKVTHSQKGPGGQNHWLGRALVRFPPRLRSSDRHPESKELLLRPRGPV
jgi:hypothetical protein